MDFKVFEAIQRQIDIVKRATMASGISASNLALVNNAISPTALVLSKDVKAYLELSARSKHSLALINNSGLADILTYNSKGIANLIPKEISAFHSYIEKMRPKGYELELLKHLGSFNAGTPFVRFDYDWSQIINPYDDENELWIDEKVIVTEAHRTREIIREIYADNSCLFTVDPRKFEEIIAELLYHQGFNVELTKQTRDNGYDIIALKLKGGLPLKFLVECKRKTKGNVGVGVVRQFFDVIRTEAADKGVLVASSYFSSPAEQRRLLDPHLMDFKDRDDVLSWISDYTHARFR